MHCVLINAARAKALLKRVGMLYYIVLCAERIINIIIVLLLGWTARPAGWQGTPGRSGSQELR